MNDPLPAVTDTAAPVVLLVEDDLPVREMATHILRTAGYAVHAASSAEEADGLLARLEADRPVSLLFCDVVLPGRDGIDFATGLTEARPDLCVLITSGQRTSDVQERIARTGHPFLPKPYTASGLREAAASALASHPAQGAVGG